MSKYNYMKLSGGFEKNRSATFLPPEKFRTEAWYMKTISRRDHYPFYHLDMFVDVPDKVEAALQDAEWQERNYIRRVFRNKAQFLLDAGDGTEYDALLSLLLPARSMHVKLPWSSYASTASALKNRRDTGTG